MTAAHAPPRPRDPPRPWAIVGNPENRRVALFREALAARGLPPPLVLPWADLLAGRRSIGEVPDGAVLRVDSPGENWAVEKALLAAGAEAAAAEGTPVISPAALAGLAEDRGLILHPRQWFLGLRATLTAWDAALAGRDILRTAPAAGVLTMFDKPACHAALQAAGVPVPESLGPVRGFGEFTERAAAAGWDRVFLKPAHGSSASGVLALHRTGGGDGGGGWTAVTGAESVRGPGGVRLYNSLRVRRYAEEADVRALVDEVARHRAHAERWLPKATLAGRGFDLRVVSVAGGPRHAVARTARGPLTNLHLGGRRGNLDAARSAVGPAAWAAAMGTVTAAAAVFPRTLAVGWDVLLTPGGRSHAILEANAFGDLLPRLTHRGESTYGAQVAAVGDGWPS